MDINALHDLLLQMDDRQQRLFGCDCVERVIHLIEAKNPHEKRSRRALEAASKYAMGLIDHAELVKAREQGLSVCGAFEMHPLKAVAIAAAAVACDDPWDLYQSCLNDWAVGRLRYGQEDLLASLMGYAASVSRSVVGFRASREQQVRDEAEASEYEWQLERARWYLDGENAQ
jgi:hypothetical protein